ncbi:heavy-metal-associated domain-containing protein [Paucihalobacter sp.]|uniref:heavy-metal-associated domain-containing protein n=1 Tax=Paucihalobacter sp. TaxID=2850405 RepID=UPI002FE0876B
MKHIVIMLAMVLGMTAIAQNKNMKASIEVDGICEMCKARIEKAAIKTAGVKSAVWSIETHELRLIFDERKTNLKEIQKSLANVGHDTKAFKATDEAYNGLHACCKYRDETVKNDHK